MDNETKERLDKLTLERDKLNEQIVAINKVEERETNKILAGKCWKRPCREESQELFEYGQSIIEDGLLCQFTFYYVPDQFNMDFAIKVRPYFYPAMWEEITKEEFSNAWNEVVIKLALTKFSQYI